MVCPYITSRKCAVREGLFDVKPRCGGTNRFLHHLSTNEKLVSSMEPARFRDHTCRNRTSEAAELAIIIDLRSMNSSENHKSIFAYVEVILNGGQSITHGVNINPQSYLASRAAVDSSIEKLSNEWHKNFVRKQNDSSMDIGDAVALNGVTLKTQC